MFQLLAKYLDIMIKYLSFVTLLVQNNWFKYILRGRVAVFTLETASGLVRKLESEPDFTNEVAK